MPNNLDLLMAALDEGGSNATVTTVINIDSNSNSNTSKSNPKVAGVKRKASSNTQSSSNSSNLPSSLANILSTESSDLVLPPPILAEDSGVIRCICIFDDDDGFSIQCERCFAWQHGLCVNVTPDAVPESYICPLCAASATAINTTNSASPRKRASRASASASASALSNTTLQYTATVGISKSDRDRATQLQRLRKEAEANLRRQRIELGLPLSSSDGAFFGESAGGYPPAPADVYAANVALEQQLQDEELELLAQARGLAYQQSKRLQLPQTYNAGGAGGADTPDASSNAASTSNRRSKSHSPAVPLPLNTAQQILQPSAQIHPNPHRQGLKLEQLDAGTGLGELQPPPSTTVKKRRSANQAAAALKQQQNEDNKASFSYVDGVSNSRTGKESQTPTQPSNARKRRSGVVPGSAQSSASLLALAKEDESLGPPSNIAQSAAVAGLSASVTSGSTSMTGGEKTKEAVRPSRSRLMSSIGVSGMNQATPAPANQLQQPAGSSLIDTALHPITQNNDNSGTSNRKNPQVSSEDEAHHLDRDDEDDEDNDSDIDERYEPWQFEYTPISKLRYSSRELQNKIQGLVMRAVEEERENLVSGNTEPVLAAASQGKENTDTDMGQNDTKAASDATFAVPSLPSSTKPSRPGFLTSTSSFLGSHLSLSSSTRNGSPVPSSGSSTPVYSSTGVASSLSCPIQPVFLTSSTPLSSIANDLPRRSVKPLATSSLSLAPPACTPFSGPTSIVPSLMNPYPRPTIHGVFTTCSYPSGSLISIMHGQVFDGKEYRADPINQWNELGVLKNHTRGIGLPWDIVLDQRKWGDETRFVRQGCHPNVFIRPLIVRKNGKGAESSTSTGRKNNQLNKENTSSRKTLNATATRKAINAMLQGGNINEGNSDEWELSFGLYALQDISKREELVLPFDWSDDHVVHSLHTLLFEPSLVFPPDIPAQQLYRSSSGGAGLGNGTDTSDDNDNDPDADGHDGIGRSARSLNSATSSSFSTLSQTQRQAISNATQHLYRLSKLANMTCLTLLGTTICACEKRRDCAIAWLWKLASFSEINPKTRNNANLLLSASTSSNAAMADFDLKGLKIACATALATEEKAGGAYNGTTRGSKKMGRKRRADLGALVGLVRGWNAFQRFSQRKEEKNEEDEDDEHVDVQEQEEAEDEGDDQQDTMQDEPARNENGPEEEEQSMQIDPTPSQHSLHRDHPTMTLPPASTMSDVPEEVDMLMPTPTSSNSRSRQRNEFDFTTSNIPPILRSIMHNHDPQIAHKRNAEGEEEEQNRDRESDSDLTEPLPSDGDDNSMRVDAADEEIVRPPKRRKSLDQSKGGKTVSEEPSSKKAKSGKKLGKGKNSKLAAEAAEEAVPEKRRKKSKQTGASNEQPGDAEEVRLPKIVKKALKAKKEQQEQVEAADNAKAEASAAPSGPSLDSLFDMKLPTPPPETASQPVTAQSESNASGLPLSSIPQASSTTTSSGSTATGTSAQTSTESAETRAEVPSTAPTTAASTFTAGSAVTQPEKPSVSQVRKLSFRDYKQRVSTSQPVAPKAPLAVAIPEEKIEQVGQSAPAKEPEQTTPIVSPALSPDKMDIDTPAPAPSKESPELASKDSEPAPEESQPVKVPSPKAPSPPPAPAPAPAPRARLSFKAYRERLSASGTSTALSPASATKTLDLEPITPKPAVPGTILEQAETITEEPAPMLKADEQATQPVMTASATTPPKDVVEPVAEPSISLPQPVPASEETVQKTEVSVKSPVKGEDSEEEGEVVTDPVSEPGEVRSSQPPQEKVEQENPSNLFANAYQAWTGRTPSPPPRSSTQARARSPAPRQGSPPFENRYASREQRFGQPASPPPKDSAGTPPGRPVQLQRSTGPLSPQAAPSSLQGGSAPPTGPRNPVAPPPPAWSGRGRGFTGRGRGFGASTYRPGPPPSAPRADREGQPLSQPPSAPRALRGGYQGPNTRGGYGGRGAPSGGPGRDAGWPSRGRRGRGNWQSDR